MKAIHSYGDDEIYLSRESETLGLMLQSPIPTRGGFQGDKVQVLRIVVYEESHTSDRKTTVQYELNNSLPLISLPIILMYRVYHT